MAHKQTRLRSTGTDRKARGEPKVAREPDDERSGTRCTAGLLHVSIARAHTSATLSLRRYTTGDAIAFFFSFSYSVQRPRTF